MIFTEHCGLVAPLPQKDVDTDLIIPAEFLKSTRRGGYGENLFRRLRDAHPEFFLNQGRYRSASILVADNNFGCGSSREHAVWALLEAGFKIVIAKSFSDIFSSNSGKNGLILVTLPESVVDRLLIQAVEDDLRLTVKLTEQVVCLPSGEEVHFPFDPFTRHCLINGVDELDYLLEKRVVIDDFRRHQRLFVSRPLP